MAVGHQNRHLHYGEMLNMFELSNEDLLAVSGGASANANGGRGGNGGNGGNSRARLGDLKAIGANPLVSGNTAMAGPGGNGGMGANGGMGGTGGNATDATAT